MFRRSVLTALGALVLVVAPLAAQGRPGRPGAGWWMRGPAEMVRNPMQVLLDHKADLALTADQVQKLEAIRAKVDKENGPRWEQLKKAFGDKAPADMTVEERQALRERMQALQPVSDKVRETNRTATTEARALLTPEQLTKMRDIMRRGPGNRPGRGGPGGSGGYRGGPTRG